MSSVQNIESQPDLRVLCLTLGNEDAVLCAQILTAAGIDCTACPDLDTFCPELEAGGGALLVTEDALSLNTTISCLMTWLHQQPPWSDLPVVLLTHAQAGADTITRAMEILGNVTLLERPVRPMTLVSTVRMALRARQRQYQLREHLAQREQTEAMLRLSEERFRTAFAHAPIGMVLTDLDGRFLYVNEAYCRIVGYDEQELLQPEFTYMRLTYPDDLPDNLKAMARLQAGEIPAFFIDKRYIRKDGRLIWVRVSSTARRDERGRPFQIIGLVEDISERKRSEDTLRRQNERLELLSEAAGSLLRLENQEEMVRGLFAKMAGPLDLHAYLNFLISETGDTLQLDSCAGIPEEKAEEIVLMGSGEYVCGTVARQCQPIYVAAVQQSSDAKVQLIRRLGLRAYVCHPLLARGRLLGTLSFATRGRDRFSEEDLAFLRTVCHYVALATDRLMLEKKLRTNMEQLAGVNQRLADADQRKDEFLAMLAHELRNPLSPIRNAVHVLQLIGPPEAAFQRQSGVIDRQVTHLVRLVDDLLDVSRITRGKITLKREVVELREVVGRAIETVQPLIEGRKHHLEVSLPQEPLHAAADPVRLAQVVANLLNNAAKYTEEGGRIWLALERCDQNATIRIQDNGSGIRPELLPRIFELFSQAEHSLDRTHGGLGIGLFLVRRLAELHGGTVQAWSAGPGQGSTFVVRLPLLVNHHGLSPGAGAATAGQIGHGIGDRAGRVLIVDDNVDAANSLAELLAIWGQHVKAVHDGSAALEATRSFRPQLILLDIGLPGMDGYEVARRLRQEPEGKNVMLVALTGYGQEEDRQLAIEAGCDRHFTKPMDLEQLRDLLHAIVADPPGATIDHQVNDGPGDGVNPTGPAGPQRIGNHDAES